MFARMLAPAWWLWPILALVVSREARAQTCGAEDFSVIYNGRAYFTVSANNNGTCTIAGPLMVGGLASMPAGAAVGSSLSVAGPTQFTSAYSGGAVTCAGGLAITGGSLVVNSGITQFLTGAVFSNVAPSFPAGIAGPVTFSGATTHSAGLTAPSATISGGLTVSGSSSLAALTASSAAVSGAGSFGSLSVGGNVAITGSITNAWQLFQRTPANWQNNVVANKVIQNIAGDTCVTFTCPKSQCLVMLSSSGHFNRDTPSGCWIMATHTIDNIATVPGQPAWPVGGTSEGNYAGALHTYTQAISTWSVFELHQTATVGLGSHTSCLRGLASVCSGNWYFNGMGMYVSVLQI